MARQSDQRNAGLGGALEALPTDRLMEQSRELMSVLAERAVAVATDKVGDVTDRLVDYVESGGSGHGGGDGKPSMAKTLLGVGAAGVKQAVAGKLGGGGKGGGGGGKKIKVTNIVEGIDVGVPVRVAYNQWTQFQDFPKYTKRLERVEQTSEEKLTWKAGIFLSHRTWESTIVEQVPDELIVWRSKGDKGSADGTVTFHELAPNLTRILLVLEYRPQGLFERTGNLWRAQGRRVRLELKHFRRHVMTRTILDPDGVEGWRGEIRDGEVVRSHEEAMEEEQGEGGEESQEPEDEYDEEQPEDDEEQPQDEDDEEQPQDEDDEEEYDDGGEEEEDREADEEDYGEDAYADGEELPAEEDEADWDEEDRDDEDRDDEDSDEEDREEEDSDEEPQDEYDDEYDDDEYENENDEEPARRGSRRELARSR
ncbi:SRPBCC family protein [Kitasatospora sp. NPDC127111]|uniref:SRPBCC family protein n=1 Tax=Kitasatospora sp. NPDC127111 TaxID=3345363 RepID=UPI0036441096